MNRFFGKTSQKLCMAGFVVCAALAPVFQLEAVQDFILFDFAETLIGRPLTRPHVYRTFLRGLSLFFPAAALLFFGFLYSVATFPRLSGYFRGAARELKDFFHNKDVFNRRNGRILLAVFAVTFIGYFALVRGSSGYLDDLYRQDNGTYGWLARYGRVITEAVNLALHGAYSIHDRSPLGQIVAMGVLSIAALVMALAFGGLLQHGGRYGLKWYNVAAAMIIVFNPYFLSCFAFKYDSPAMALSILFPLVPFLFMGATRLYSVSSFACVLGMYMTYQSSSGIYIMMVVFAALLKYITEEWSLREAAKFCAKSALLFVAASAVFMGFSSFFNSASNRSTAMALGANIAFNIAAYLKAFVGEFNALWKLLSVLVAAAAGAAVCSISKRKKPIALALFAIALALTLVISFGGYIFLEEYPANARYRYGAGAWLAMLASISCLGSWRKKLLAAPAVLLAWSFFSYASAFGNAHANQMKMELQYETLVRQDINELFPQEEYPQLELGFFGVMPWSGEVANLAKKYPITEALVMRRYGPSYFMAGRTMEYFDAALATSDTPAAPREELTLLLERRYYNILLEEGTGRVIVECRM